MLNQLRAGVARIDISPPAGITQGVWGAQTHQRAKGLDMPFYATALVLEQGELRLAVLDVDLIGFLPDQVDEIRGEITRQTGIEEEHIRLCATHAHSGPNYLRTDFFTEGLDLLGSYMKALPVRLGAAVWEATQELHPVEIGCGTGTCTIAVNRRQKLEDGRVVVGCNPDGPVDHCVRVVRLNRDDGAALATLLHYSCHPTVLAWENRYLSPDYPGPARAEVERAVGGYCLFLQGAAGDIGPVEGYTGDLAVAHRLGRVLGLEAASVGLRIDAPPRRKKFEGVMESGASIAVYDREPVFQPMQLEILNRTICLPLKEAFPDTEKLRETRDRFMEDLSRARKAGDAGQVRKSLALVTQTSLRIDLARKYEGQTSLAWQIQAIAIGPLVLIGVPGEPFVEIGEAVQKRSPFPHTLFSGYTNGGFGYLPVADAYPDEGYEVQASPFAPEAAALLVEECVDLLEELNDRVKAAVREAQTLTE